MVGKWGCVGWWVLMGGWANEELRGPVGGALLVLPADAFGFGPAPRGPEGGSGIGWPLGAKRWERG